MELLTPLYRPDFDATAHKYAVDGKNLPNLTGLLRDSGIFDMSHFTVEGRDRGTRVHKACDLMIRGELDWSTVDEADAGYVQAWEKFMKEHHYKPEFSETPIASLLYRFACTPDNFGKIATRTEATKCADRLTIIDIKTGAENRKYERLQTAGQLLALRENFPGVVFDQRMAVHLRPDGSYSLGKVYTKHTEDINEFRAILTVHNLKNTKE